MTDAVELPRFARDVRVLGRAGEAAEPRAPNCAGVLPPFSGLLQPGLATGQWPPPTLSHLALADLLARHLHGEQVSRTGPEQARRSRSEPATDRTSDGPIAGDTDDDLSEPTVREVVHQAGRIEDDRQAETARRDADRPTQTAPGTAESRGRSSADDRAGDAGPSGIDTGSVVESRTGLRAVGGDHRDAGHAVLPHAASVIPARPGGRAGRIPTSVVQPRTILQHADAGSASESSGRKRRPRSPLDPNPSGMDADSPGVSDDSQTPSVVADESVASTSPVDLTVASVPLGPGPLVPSGGATEPTRSGRPPTPALEPLDGSASGPQRPASSGGPAPTDLTLTVRRAGQAQQMSERADQPGALGGPGQSDGATGAGRVSSPPTGTDEAADTAGSASGADGPAASERLADEAGSAERAISRAIESPRVVDRLYRAIERRRRIERERGGRP